MFLAFSILATHRVEYKLTSLNCKTVKGKIRFGWVKGKIIEHYIGDSEVFTDWS